MATMNEPAAERRHIPERRSHHSAKHVMGLSALDWVAMVLMIIGAVSWGLVGVLDLDLVANTFGVHTPITRFVDAVLGLSGLYGVYRLTTLAARR